MSEFTDSPKLASSGSNRKKLAQSEPKLVTSLVQLMDSTSLKVQCQAALALRNLASDGSWFSSSAVGLAEC
jgi:Armadillo/beta-catenin-like repeat